MKCQISIKIKIKNLEVAAVIKNCFIKNLNRQKNNKFITIICKSLTKIAPRFKPKYSCNKKQWEIVETIILTNQ